MNKRNLFIIIEGPDNVGKSTLIQNLKNCYNDYTFHALHYSNVKQSNNDIVVCYSKKLYNEMFDLMLETSKLSKAGVICDRSHIGEMVYGPIYRGYSGEYVLDIEHEFSHIHPLWDNLFLFTLYDEPENLIKRDDGLSFSTDLEKKRVEINNFKHAHSLSTIKHKMLLNIKEHNAEQALNACVNFIKDRK